jgi:hypothetical protein
MLLSFEVDNENVSLAHTTTSKSSLIGLIESEVQPH